MPALLDLDPSFFALLATTPPEINSTDNMEEEGFQVHEEGDIPIYLIEDLPAYEFHPKIGMGSEPTVSQQEYQRNIQSLG